MFIVPKKILFTIGRVVSNLLDVCTYYHEAWSIIICSYPSYPYFVYMVLFEEKYSSEFTHYSVYQLQTYIIFLINNTVTLISYLFVPICSIFYLYMNASAIDYSESHITRSSNLLKAVKYICLFQSFNWFQDLLFQVEHSSQADFRICILAYHIQVSYEERRGLTIRCSKYLFT